MRILRGIVTLANRPPKKGTEEWRWEATGYPMQGFYVWDTIIVHPPEDIPESGVFTKDRLERIALQADAHNCEQPFTLIEHLAYFMVGCLTALGARYQEMIAADIIFSPPKQID